MKRSVALTGIIAILLCTPAWARDPAPKPLLSLEAYGPISTPQEAEAALGRALREIAAGGGGILVIPASAPTEMRVYNDSQQADDAPAVTIIDQRQGVRASLLPGIGERAPVGFAAKQVERTLRVSPSTLRRFGIYSLESIRNNIVSGTSSYYAMLATPVERGKDRRCYPETIQGILVGQRLSFSERAQRGGAFEEIVVESIGWDDQQKRHYFVADVDLDHEKGAALWNKNIASALRVETFSNSDNQTPGDVFVERRHYAPGDAFLYNGYLYYMSDIMSGGGDEGAVVFNAEPIGEVDAFHSTVESVDWSTDELRYAPGRGINAHTLSTSRPIMNMKPDKWITGGSVYIVRPGYRYRGKHYPAGAVVCVEKCDWTRGMIGRFFALTDPTELLSPEDAYAGYAKSPPRPIHRWYAIRDLESGPGGAQVLVLAHTRWLHTELRAPTLYRVDNYTWQGHEQPLSYAIAPGALVYDVSAGWVDDSPSTRRVVGASDPRRLKLMPTGERGTRYDFESGDPIEQAIGPNPWLPVGLRVRHFNQVPGQGPSASILLANPGRVQVTDAIRIESHSRDREELSPRSKDRLPPYRSALAVKSLTESAIVFDADVTRSAIDFRQPHGRTQPIRWFKTRGVSTLSVPPESGDFEFSGGDIDVRGGSFKGAKGISGSEVPAVNLRGINVAVSTGTSRSEVSFPKRERDERYAVGVTPSWPTSVAVTRKSPQGFTVEFGSAAPRNGRYDWIMIR